MKLKYIGIAPITNIYGDWENGTIREVPDGINLAGFEKIETKPLTPPPSASRKFTRRIMREELKDKFERDNYQIKE
jgi:hypothetical protein